MLIWPTIPRWSKRWNSSVFPTSRRCKKAAGRLLAAKSARRLLDATVRQQMGRRRRVPSAAVDSTGLQCGTASAYFVRRRKKVGSSWKTVVYHRYPKLDVVSNTSNHFILAFHVGRDLRLLALAHNIMIPVIVEIFCDAILTPFLVLFMSCLMP